MFTRITLVALAVALAGCTSDNDLSGNWIGTWSGGGANGTVTESLSQSGDTVTGTAAFAGSPCWNAAQLSLVVAGDNLSGSASAGEIAGQISATWTTDHIDGTFEVTSLLCTGTGTFALDRQ
jgi:hypothetical protein